MADVFSQQICKVHSFIFSLLLICILVNEHDIAVSKSLLAGQTCQRHWARQNDRSHREKGTKGLKGHKDGQKVGTGNNSW